MVREVSGEMREPVLVQMMYPLPKRKQAIDVLLRRLRAEGIEARGASVGGEGGAPEIYWQVVTLWFAATTGAAIINQVVRLAVDWAKERFQQPSEPDNPRRNGMRIVIVRYEGNIGQVENIIELEAEDADPVRRSPEESERFPRYKPLERATWDLPESAEETERE